MKFYGSITGKKTKSKSGRPKEYHVDAGQIVEAPEGEFDESVAEIISESEERKSVQISEGEVAETASFKSPGKKRNK